MKKKIVVSYKARSSIKNISDYLKENASPEVAKYVRDGIFAKCKSLKDFSGYSVERFLEDEPEKYQSVTHWDYNIIFKVVINQVRVLNVVHCKQHPSVRKQPHN